MSRARHYQHVYASIFVSLNLTNPMKLPVILYWTARIVAAIIMVQTLYFKFTASPESVYIFTTVGMEPWGRIGAGVTELIASILILINITAWIGAGIALGVMMGALLVHLTVLGVVVRGDHGQLFLYAIIVTVCCLYILWHNRKRIETLVSRYRKGKG
jgi:uncharacterized membrane protein YphA (DoxX/SURF4 family)